MQNEAKKKFVYLLNTWNATSFYVSVIVLQYVFGIHYRPKNENIFSNDGKLNLTALGNDWDPHNIHIPLKAHIRNDADVNEANDLFDLAGKLMSIDPGSRIKISKYSL